MPLVDFTFCGSLSGSPKTSVSALRAQHSNLIELSSHSRIAMDANRCEELEEIQRQRSQRSQRSVRVVSLDAEDIGSVANGEVRRSMRVVSLDAEEVGEWKEKKRSSRVMSIDVESLGADFLLAVEDYHKTSDDILKKD